MANPRFNTQTTNPRGKTSTKKRVKKNMGGIMGPVARRDNAAGYYPSDMGMQGGAMYKKGGKV